MVNETRPAFAFVLPFQLFKMSLEIEPDFTGYQTTIGTMTEMNWRGRYCFNSVVFWPVIEMFKSLLYSTSSTILRTSLRKFYPTLYSRSLHGSS